MTFDETKFWDRIERQNAATMAAAPTQVGYTIESAAGTRRFTVRAGAEGYLIGLGITGSGTASSMLTNAYLLRQIGCGYTFGDVTVTFDGGNTVTK